MKTYRKKGPIRWSLYAKIVCAEIIIGGHHYPIVEKSNLDLQESDGQDLPKDEKSCKRNVNETSVSDVNEKNSVYKKM